MSADTTKLSKTVVNPAMTKRASGAGRLLALLPRMSEKTHALAQAGRVYVFAAPGAANKHIIKRAVEARFDVTVESVNVLNQKGKPKRTVHKRQRPATGRQRDIKKVYVTLKKGDKLPIFEATEEADRKVKKQEAKTKPGSDGAVATDSGKSAVRPTGAGGRGPRRLFRRLTK